MRPMRPMPRLPNHVISPSKSFQLQLYQSQLLKYSRDFRKTQETPLPLQLQHPRPLDSGHHHALHLMCQRSLKPTLRARKQHGDFGRDLRCRFRWSPITFVFGSRKKINHKADSLQTTKAGWGYSWIQVLTLPFCLFSLHDHGDGHDMPWRWCWRA